MEFNAFATQQNTFVKTLTLALDKRDLLVSLKKGILVDDSRPSEKIESVIKKCLVRDVAKVMANIDGSSGYAHMERLEELKVTSEIFTYGKRLFLNSAGVLEDSYIGKCVVSIDEIGLHFGFDIRSDTKFRSYKKLNTVRFAVAKLVHVTWSENRQALRFYQSHSALREIAKYIRSKTGYERTFDVILPCLKAYLSVLPRNVVFGKVSHLQELETKFNKMLFDSFMFMLNQHAPGVMSAVSLDLRDKSYLDFKKSLMFAFNHSSENHCYITVVSKSVNYDFMLNLSATKFSNGEWGIRVEQAGVNAP